MPHPEQYARHLRAAAEQAAVAPGPLRGVDEVPFTVRLVVPVVLVTEARGREVFRSSFRLFARLEALAKHNVSIMQLREDGRVLHPRSVAALETMLKKCGWRNFERAARLRKGPERAKKSRWAWEYLGEYLGFKWERSA
ncbi:hypothetical protein OpiT1DRAFT_04761 [Opitutaceae bacterium TAV1]|nr:hypothetical protein OpiT1DRAFT_04761 [Opitutaceae bacterium TAV1]